MGSVVQLRPADELDETQAWLDELTRKRFEREQQQLQVARRQAAKRRAVWFALAGSLLVAGVFAYLLAGLTGSSTATSGITTSAAPGVVRRQPSKQPRRAPVRISPGPTTAAVSGAGPTQGYGQPPMPVPPGVGPVPRQNIAAQISPSAETPIPRVVPSSGQPSQVTTPATVAPAPTPTPAVTSVVPSPTPTDPVPTPTCARLLGNGNCKPGQAVAAGWDPSWNHSMPLGTPPGQADKPADTSSDTPTPTDSPTPTDTPSPTPS